MSVGTEIEDIQLELQGLLVTLGKEKLIALCAKFKLSEENLENKTRLTLTKLLLNVIEKELGKLRDEEIVPYLNDVIQAISDGVPFEISGADKNSDADKIKEIEKEVEALKVKQKDELEAVLSRLEAARGQPGVGAQAGSGQLDNLKTLLRRDFRIAGMVAPQGQKNQLSFMSLNRQIEDGLQRGYSEREVIDAVIKCISPSLPLRDYIEAMRETGIDAILKILRAHFQEKNASELYSSLANLAQSPSEEPQNFLMRALNLREKIIFASKQGGSKLRYDPDQCQSMFLHTIETGLISNTLRSRMRVLLQKQGVTDAELISELNLAVTEESERNAKLGFGRGKAKISEVQVTPPEKGKAKVEKKEEPSVTETLLAEIKSLKSDVANLRENWNKNQAQGSLQEKPQRYRGPRKSRRGCESCCKAGRGSECTHCWKCGGNGHFAHECAGNQGNFPRLLTKDSQ